MYACVLLWHSEMANGLLNQFCFLSLLPAELRRCETELSLPPNYSAVENPKLPPAQMVFCGMELQVAASRSVSAIRS